MSCYKTIALHLIALLSSLIVSAQNTPCFSTTDTIGCTPFTVNLKNCSGAEVPRYIFETNLTIDSIYTYKTPGKYDVTQQIGTTSIEVLKKEQLVRVVDDTKPAFTINYCKDYIIQIALSKNNLYDKYIINYGDGSEIDTIIAGETPSKQYPNGSERTISVTGIYNNAPCSNFNSKNILPLKDLQLPITKEITTTKVDSSNGEITLTTSPYPFFNNSLYHSIETNGFTHLDTFRTTNSDTIISRNQLNNLTKSHCFYFRTFDYCSNELISDTICSISLIGEAENNKNEISWSTHPLPNQIIDYSFIKNTDTSSILKSITTFSDTNIICSKEYCYSLYTTNNGIKNTSNQLCLTGFSSDIPTPITAFYSSYEGNNILLSWVTPPPYIVQEIYISKSISTENNYTPFVTITTPDTTTTDIPSENSACYIINYKDKCNNLSNTNLADTTCYIQLSATKVHDSNYILSWTNFKGFTSPSYTLQYLDKENKVAFEKNLGATTSYTDETPFDEFQELVYRIKTTEGTNISYSNTVKFELKSRIFIPNAFSPDGDGVNDFFKPDTRFIKEYSLSIFNRNGELIFEETNSTNGWNGMFKEKKVPTDSYVYLLTGIDFTGAEIFKKGTVTVYY